MKNLPPLALLLLALSACDDVASDDASDGDTGAPTGPIYVLATAVSDADGANTYVKTFTSLEAQPGELDLSSAAEFPGWSDMKVLGGKVFVSSGEAPTVTRFAVGAAGQLVEDGKISFAGHGEAAHLYTQVFVGPDKAYLTSGTKEYVVWNPSTLEITGTIPLPALATREGIEPSYALDRGAAVRGNRLYHAANWFDYEGYRMLDSRIAVFDVETDTLVDVLETSCPNLDVVTEDEAGDLYFSNWVYSPGATLVNDQAKACAVRLPAGSDTIDGWNMTFADLTGGREGAALGYLGDGAAILSVFHDERVTYDPETGDIFGYLFGANWHFWTVDLADQTAQEITSIEWNGGGYYAYRIDGRTFVLSPGSDYASTTVYEITADGQAHVLLRTRGWATRLYRVR